VSLAWNEVDESVEEPALLQDLERWAAGVCADCARSLCGHQVLFSVALGFKNAPRCLACLARGLRQEVDELRDHLGQHVHHRPCYRRAWEIACEREGLPRTRFPKCLWSREPASEGYAAQDAPIVAALDTPIVPDATWAAGAMACGDLVMELRNRLLALPPGAVLRVTALDPAAPEDLPAWCRLTGHRLLGAGHPEYLIQRKKG
jgi:tRNA 2-thiouridine synthesizing protein A